MNESVEPHHQSQSSLNVVTISAVVLFLLVLYVLSPGPIGYFYQQLPNSTQSDLRPYLDMYFLPLKFLYERSDLVHQFYDWYFALFNIR